MPNVVAVRLRYNPKQLWFDPRDVNPQEGDHLIVKTDRGTEIGLAVGESFEVTDEQIAALPSDLKPVLRIATDIDLAKVDELAAKNEEALTIFRELAETYQLAMKPVRVEYLFGGEKAIFYFVSEERIDFREFVRELASMFHIRIDMRQIGVRDEARLVGGIAHCGEELCCARMGGEFQPVSIRMAKEQDLPLNPLKISGLCGRLMCCLRYEFEAYKDFKGRAPKKGILIDTPLGLAKVVDYNTLRELITLRLEDGKSFQVSLSSMDFSNCDDAKDCACRVSREALEEQDNPAISLALSALDNEQVNEAASIGEEPRRRRRHIGDSAIDAIPVKEAPPVLHPAEKKRGGVSKRTPVKQAEQGNSNDEVVPAKQKPRKRRRGGKGKGNSGEQQRAPESAKPVQTNAPQQRQAKPANPLPKRSKAPVQQKQPARPRPGQNSSGVRAKSVSNPSATSKGEAPNTITPGKRRPRRRHSSEASSGSSSKEN